MNKYLQSLSTLFFALLCLLVIPVNGQADISYGLKGGINLATLNGDTYSDLGFRRGLVIGAFATMPRSEKLSLRAEINYSQEGAQNSNLDFSTFSTVVYNQKLIYNYLNIPVSAVYSIGKKVAVIAGPQIGIRLTAKEKRTIKSGEPSPTDNSEGTREFSDRIKLIYPSINGGVEYEITDRISAQGRLHYSPFDNVTSDGGDSEGTYPFIIQVTASYKIGSLVRQR